MQNFIRVQRLFLQSSFALCALAALSPAQGTPPAESKPQAEASAAPRQAAPRFLRYVRAGAAGARARNVYDKQGLVVLDVPAGGLLAVHSERSGWLEVESPGGFSVWVFGQYVTPTTDAGVVQINGANVNLRPLPSSGVESLPLGQLLNKGDRVRLIGRKDASKPLAEDWINVWSPPGTRAWVQASETEALAADADGAALWSKAVLEARPVAPAAVAVPPANTGKDTAPQDSKAASDALAQADAIYASAREAEQQGRVPDYAAARAAYEAVLAISATGATAELARGRVELCKGLDEGYRLRAELEGQRAAVDAAIKKREADMARAKNQGVFDGRFEARGWLERRMLPGDQPVYVVKWAGDPQAEIVCTSGRYDLSLYVDYEIGVNGRELRGPITGATAAATRPRELDVTRIEIIAGRDAKKR